MEQIILDVREQDEFAAQRIEGSIWVPMSNFGHCAPGVLQRLAGKKVIIMCRSGGRAELAREQIARMGFAGQLETEVFKGGILEWIKQGRPVVTGSRSTLPVMRQVLITAGGVVSAASLAGLFWRPWAAWLAAFMGAGLLFAGITGFCGLAKLLSIMPWNKPEAETPCGGNCSCG